MLLDIVYEGIKIQQLIYSEVLLNKQSSGTVHELKNA
jgi:hypothetical protein